MKKLSIFVILPFLFYFSFGFAQTNNDYKLPRCDKAVASVFVEKFTCTSMNCKPMGGLGGLGSLMSALGAPKMTDYSAVADKMPLPVGDLLKQTGCFDVRADAQSADYKISGEINTIKITSKTVLFKKTDVVDLTLGLKLEALKTPKLLGSPSVVVGTEKSSVSISGGFGPVSIKADTMKNSPFENAEPLVQDLVARIASLSANLFVTDANAASQAAAPGAASAPTAAIPVAPQTPAAADGSTPKAQ